MDRTVIVTGASSGLGLSLVRKFVNAGDIVFGITRTRRHWASARNAVPSPHFHLHQADLSIEKEVKRVVKKVLRKAGRIDLLVNSAGYARQLIRTEDERLTEFQKHLRHNLISVFLTCKFAIPVFKKQNKGWIINVASYAGKRAVPLLGAYSASKFAVVALTQSMAKENPDAGFKCITVCPGGMNTEMRARLLGRSEARQQQSPDWVAEQIFQVVEGKIAVSSGGDVVIRHGRPAAVNPPPEA